MLGEQFTARVMRPIWYDFVQACVLSGRIRMPQGWSLRELGAALFIRPQMPWIDPLKEVLAMGERVDRGWMPDQEAIMRGGNDPEEVLRMREDWKQQQGDQAVAPAQPDPNKKAAALAYALQGDPA